MTRTAAKKPRKSSGERATEEAEQRKQSRAESAEKAKKAAAERGVTPTAPVETGRQDVFVVAGEDLRAGTDIDETADAFVFDQAAAADAKTVEHFAVAADASRLVLELDGQYIRFDVQQSLTLRRLIGAGVINLNF